MPALKPKNKEVSAFIGKYPSNIRNILEKIRETIRRAAPEADEIISYKMPAYRMKKILVYFAAFKEHISFFPTSSGIKVFKKELSGYRTSKGTVSFSPDKPIPYGLIKKIVKFRVKEDSVK
ncbi:MAG: DUF1801 domain-containing protein [Candidatus Goldiibacteriota bacterium]|jgi:uncharacterized protein YdhG (YjbR/CyaY superfamily)